jgi:hypothetical protein
MNINEASKKQLLYTTFHHIIYHNLPCSTCSFNNSSFHVIGCGSRGPIIQSGITSFGENVAKWTSPNTYPTSVAVFDSTVYCLDNIQQSLIAGGEFTHHLGTEINHIAFLDYVLRVEDLENETSDFSIFPNPCTGGFSIRNNGKAIHMELYSVEGKLIDSFLPQENAKIALPESGIYFLKTESGKCFKVVNQN